MNKILTVLASLLVASSVVAQENGFLDLSGTPVLMAKGNNPLIVGTAGSGNLRFYTNDTERLAISGSTGSITGLKLPNNTYFTAIDAAGTGTINVLKVDGTDDTELNSDAGDVIKLRIGGSTKRLFTFDASSDAAHTLTFGDSGVTGTQSLVIQASTSDADDDSFVALAGGGAFATNGTRGAGLQLKGNEASGAADVTLFAGSAAGSDITILPLATDGRTFLGANGANRWVVTATGSFENDATNGGNLNLTKAGTTLALQEATAGSACSGTLTANGATPVVTSTTCAVTGARIFLSRTSAETGVVTAWVSAISNGVSFSVTGEAGDTGTYNWFIIHEAS